MDHIIPRSKGGKTVYENLQVLCAKCNRTKQDQDQTDFREMAATYQVDCKFCEIESGQKILENELAYCTLAPEPQTPGHSLIIPKRHIADYFEINKLENDAIFDLARVRRKQLLEQDPGIHWFHFGANSGSAERERVFHVRVELVPWKPELTHRGCR